MRPKSLILLALALGCGLVAAIGISQVLESRRQHKSAGDEQTDILVALGDIERNSELSDKNVSLKPWPKTQVPAGAITKLEDVIGRRPNTRIIKDEPILEGKLGTGEGGNPASVQIPPGFGTVAVRMDNATNSGLILPGDRVDVQVFVNKGQNVPEATTTTFLHDVSVFAVNAETRPDPNGDSKMDAKTVSLLVTPEQAAKLTLAAEIGTIRLFLRGSKSEKASNPIKVTVGSILGGAGEHGGNDNNKPGAATGLDAFLTKQPPGKPAEPPADDNVFRMVIVHGDSAHVEELHKGELLPRKIDGPAPSATEPQPAPASSDDVTSNASSSSDAPSDSPSTQETAPPTTPTTLPDSPKSGKDGALQRAKPAA